MNQNVPVNEGNDDVLDIDVLMELSAGTQKRVQGLKVELVWENLFKTRCSEEPGSAGTSYNPPTHRLFRVNPYIINNQNK